jgi:hypothetical protein
MRKIVRFISPVLLLVIVILFPKKSFAGGDSLVVVLTHGQGYTIALADIKKITFANIAGSGVETAQSPVDQQLTLNGVFPNPAQEEISFDFEVATPGEVDISLFDFRGVRIRRIVTPHCEIGKNRVIWNLRDAQNEIIPNGVYNCEIRFGVNVHNSHVIVSR